MSVVFADSGYWVALINPLDTLRAVARRVSGDLGPIEIVTSEMVLIEVLNHFSRLGPRLRGAAVDAIGEMVNDPKVEVVELSSAFFNSALVRYASRLDQRWSLVDCSSFVLMEERGIRDALAHDVDFVQAGFNALLRSG